MIKVFEKGGRLMGKGEGREEDLVSGREEEKGGEKRERRREGERKR